ncbi:MAG: serine--tRNA ligase [Euryarchaeota archaeon]|nr:serine--tRNA ligase [Euryarchaeota archaeon]
MLDIALFRDNPETVRDDLRKRKDAEKLAWVDEIIRLDKEWKNLKMETDDLRHQRNKIALEIGKLKKEGKDASEQIKEAAEIPKKIEKKEKIIQEKKEKIEYYLMRLPNILHESVPVGEDEHDNVEIKKFGSPPEFDFEPKSHLDLLVELGLIDQERGAKTAGHGFSYLKGDLVKLDRAIMSYAIDFLSERGYIPIEPPFMMKRESYEGVTDLSDFENVMYKIENDNRYLIATSEHPMAAMYKDEVILKDMLPIKLVGFSPCFRKEVGTHGKYTRGLYRMHQFNKIEQFIFSHPDRSWEYHKELQKNSEELYDGLGLHFRVVSVCTGDMGTIAAKKYDTEMWMVDGAFRELGSNSNCTDYQARRLHIRYRKKEGKPPAGCVHTLNNTALATSRTMIAIIEQCQNEDGSITVPKILRKYTGFGKIEKEED